MLSIETKELDAAEWVANGNGIHKGMGCVAITHGDDRHAIAQAIVARCQAFDALVPALRACFDQLVAYEENGWLGHAWRTRIGLPEDIARARAVLALVEPETR